ncbi:signal peptidase I SipW [Alkalihalobacillus sp. AL-G]|uniref:signal peptidase I SipW n=1 Tax=Alkalihalobacillus sp. AL-G TaxID=2926399 RepID=UPI002729559D|nr:signal peptidase I [Alkalihalobacillus sp. AL-G]WLD95395.1 signal peptidase I [Alkalihalobacillus sp. AL-G]
MKIISSLTTVLLFLTFVLMAFVVISSKASGGEPNFFGYQLKTVLSGSMEPTFSTGSIIAVKPINNISTINKGDVITFMKDQTNIVTHRIIDVRGSNQSLQYITKGDNNEDPDNEPVLADNVIGEYTGFTIPFLGYLMNFANSKIGSALLLIVPGIVLLIYSGLSIWRALREIDDTKGKQSTEVNS